MGAMTWGTVELTAEVGKWLGRLSTKEHARAANSIDRLAETGPCLGMPYVRPLGGGLWELRFHLGEDERRITYWIAPGRRIILLTVFRKTRMREEREVERARKALKRVQKQDLADKG
jgi:hypothetical protein